MSGDVYFEHTGTGRKYKVVSIDQIAGTITLVGDHGRPFTEKFDKARFKAMGYKPVKG